MFTDGGKKGQDSGNSNGLCLKTGFSYKPLTSVDDCLPLVEVAFVWQRVEVTALDVSKRGEVVQAWCGATDLVPPPLSQTILPSVFRTV